MATKMITQTFCPYSKNYRKEFICDTDADFADLPSACTGSTALSIESGNIRMVNTKGEWVAFAEAQ